MRGLTSPQSPLGREVGADFASPNPPFQAVEWKKSQLRSPPTPPWGRKTPTGVESNWGGGFGGAAHLCPPTPPSALRVMRGWGPPTQLRVFEGLSPPFPPTFHDPSPLGTPQSPQLHHLGGGGVSLNSSLPPTHTHHTKGEKHNQFLTIFVHFGLKTCKIFFLYLKIYYNKDKVLTDSQRPPLNPKGVGGISG